MADNFYAKYPITSGGGGSGTVTSVGLSMPSIFTVTGSPVTTSGTLTASLNNEAANIVFAGPATGAAAVPTFRGIVLADLPTIAATNITYTPTVSGDWSTVPTDVGLALDDLSSSGIFKSQAQNLFLASPDGSSGLPSFRAITAADIPVPTGTADTVAGFDSSGNLESIPGWGIAQSTTGGMSQNLNYAPVDPVSPQTHVFNHFINSLAPSANLTQLNMQGWRNDYTLSGPFTIGDFRSIFNVLQYQGAGVMGNMIGQDVSIVMGDGSVSTSSDDTGLNQRIELAANHTANSVTGINLGLDTDSGSTVAGSIKIINSNTTIASGSSVQDVNGFSNSITLNAAVGGNVQLDSHQVEVNVNQSPGVSLGFVNYGGDISGTVQSVTGVNYGPSLQSGATITNGYQSFLDHTYVYSGATTNGMTSYNASITMDSGAIVNSAYNAFVANPNIAADLTGTGVNMHMAGGQFSNAMDYSNGFSVSANFASGANVINGYSPFVDNSQIQSGSTINSVTSYAANPNYNTGATMTNGATGFSYNPSGGATLPSLTGARISLNGLSGSISNITGLDIQVGSLVDLANPQGPIGISSDGRMQVNAATTMQPAQGFQIGNRIASQMHVPSGSPVTGTDFIGNNFAGDLSAEDDVALGPIGLGWDSVGFIASLAVAATKTVDSVTVFLPAASLPNPGYTTGGNITDMYMIRTFPPLSQGGTANITNLYGFKIDSLFGDFSSAATNAWGLYLEDANLNNWIEGKLVIGGTTSLPFSNSSLSIGDQSLLTGDVHAEIRNVHAATDPTVFAVDAGYAGFTSDIFTDNSVTAVVGIHNTTKVVVAAGKTIGGQAGIFNTVSRVETGDDGSVPFVFGALTSFASGNSATKNTGLYASYFTGFHSIDSNAGQITDMYDFLAQASSIGAGAATNRYGIVVEADSGYTKQNWLSGFVRLGGSSLSPVASALEVNGTADMLSNNIVNVLDPVNPQDAATKNYVDTAVSTAVPMTTAGDIIYENATPAPARLPIGAEGQVLAVASGLPAWVGPSVSVIPSTAIDWSAVGFIGGMFTQDLTANTTFTFSNQTAGQTVVVRLTNTVSNYTVTWPTVKWVGGTPPTMSPGAVSDIYTFIFDGTDTFGSAVQNMS